MATIGKCKRSDGDHPIVAPAGSSRIAGLDDGLGLSGLGVIVHACEPLERVTATPNLIFRTD
jgi:hypothetical protein